MFKVWLRSHLHLIILNLMVSSAVRKKYKTEQNYWVQSFKRWSKVEGTRKYWWMGNCHYTDGILLTLPDLVVKTPTSPGWEWLTVRKSSSWNFCLFSVLRPRIAQLRLTLNSICVFRWPWAPDPHTHTHTHTSAFLNHGITGKCCPAWPAVRI